jgi:hypothetical protein
VLCHSDHSTYASSFCRIRCLTNCLFVIVRMMPPAGRMAWVREDLIIQRSGPLVRRRTGFVFPAEAVSHGGSAVSPRGRCCCSMLLLDPALSPIAHDGPLTLVEESVRSISEKCRGGVHSPHSHLTGHSRGSVVNRLEMVRNWAKNQMDLQ